MPSRIDRRRLRHIAHAATAISRDEWNRAYRDARRIAAARDGEAIAVANPRGPRIVEARRYSVKV
jgi:hypothetical protein